MKPAQRVFWLRQLHQWHWVSAALSLIGMLVFSVTGVTLNHAADIPAKPKVVTLESVVPQNILAGALKKNGAENHPLPDELRKWLATELAIKVKGQPAEWSADEIYLPLPRPGGDAWLSIDRVNGEVLYESTARGWVSYFNDLHKGRDTGVAWRWFIDVFAGACIVFCLTGLVLLQFHAVRRPSTWPLVGIGFIAPALLIILFIH